MNPPRFLWLFALAAVIALIALHFADQWRHESELAKLHGKLGASRSTDPPRANAPASWPPLPRLSAPIAPGRGDELAEAPDTAGKPPPLEASEVRNRLEQSFTSQTADVRWADEARHTAETRLAAVLPETSRLQLLECKASMCRIETVHQGLDGYRRFVHSAFMNLETRLWNGGFFAATLGDPVDGKVVTVAYLAREGQDLPRIGEAP